MSMVNPAKVKIGLLDAESVFGSALARIVSFVEAKGEPIDGGGFSEGRLNRARMGSSKFTGSLNEFTPEQFVGLLRGSLSCCPVDEAVTRRFKTSHLWAL